MKPLLEIRNLTKSFGGLKAVDDVSLTVEEGKITGLIGPNGSGKTTLFNTIAGIHKPDSGEILCSSERIDGLTPDAVFHKGLVRAFQIPRLFSGMTVLENLMMAPRNQIGEKLRYAPRPSKWVEQETLLAGEATSVLKLLELGRVYDNLSTEVSGGQMKLSEIGRTLMGEPRFLLLDEPTAGVAPHLAMEIFNKILALRESHALTFFIIEHRLEMFLQHVDYVYVMDRGRVIAQGDPERVVNDPMVQEVYLGGLFVGEAGA